MLPWSRFRSEDGEGFQLSSHLRGNADSEAPRLPERVRRLKAVASTVHSADTLAGPRNRNLRAPCCSLMIPKTGPANCFRSLYIFLASPVSIQARCCIARPQFQATSLAAVLCADSEGWTLPAAVPAPLCYACSGRSAGFVPWASNNSRCPRRR